MNSGSGVRIGMIVLVFFVLFAFGVTGFVLDFQKKAANRPAVNAPAMPAAGTSAITYQNAQYGFSFALPDDWKGYSILTDAWSGDAAAPGVETGPLLSIRHPQWTKETPRQDIPIMIFTHDQWDAMQRGDFHVGAAPINPAELGRNASYVFALPARYNYAFPEGYQDVERILQHHPLQTF